MLLPHRPEGWALNAASLNQRLLIHCTAADLASVIAESGCAEAGAAVSMQLEKPEDQTHKPQDSVLLRKIIKNNDC